jgi:hypothetical protein
LNFELQHPQAEWEQLRRKWDFELHNAGTPDPNTQTRRIPIEDAKNAILGQLTASRQQQGAQLQSGIDIPSASSAGRQPEKRDR